MYAYTYKLRPEGPQKYVNNGRVLLSQKVWPISSSLSVYVCIYTYTFMYLRNTSMYVFTYVRTYVRMYVRTYVGMYVCMYVCTYVCTYVRMYVCMHACMYVCMCVCVCMYVCMHACMHACKCIHIYIYVLLILVRLGFLISFFVYIHYHGWICARICWVVWSSERLQGPVRGCKVQVLYMSRGRVLWEHVLLRCWMSGAV